MSASDPSDLKKLTAKWYAKLKAEGFEDLEDQNGMLKAYASSNFKSELKAGRQWARQSREEYYRAAGHLLWDYTFESALDRKIWEMHANGASALEIANRLKLPRKGKDTILKTINRLADIMGVKCRS